MRNPWIPLALAWKIKDLRVDASACCRGALLLETQLTVSTTYYDAGGQAPDVKVKGFLTKSLSKGMFAPQQHPKPQGGRVHFPPQRQFHAVPWGGGEAPLTASGRIKQSKQET